MSRHLDAARELFAAAFPPATASDGAPWDLADFVRSGRADDTAEMSAIVDALEDRDRGADLPRARKLLADRYAAMNRMIGTAAAAAVRAGRWDDTAPMIAVLRALSQTKATTS